MAYHLKSIGLNSSKAEIEQLDNWGRYHAAYHANVIYALQKEYGGQTDATTQSRFALSSWL